MPVAAMRDVLRNAAGAAAEPGRQGAAADALDGHRGNDPTARNVTPFTGIVDASHGTATRTRAEVEVVQDAQGNVVSVRIVRSARVAGFDEAALHAVREALPLQAAVPMPGGRRSRWSFEVVASRDPIIPAVGFAFDESNGWFELHYPGRLHLRSRVWLEGASPLGS
jgi:TonB family protein